VYVSLMHLRTFCVRVRPTVQIYTLSLHDALPIFGLVTNMTGVNERLVPAIDLFFDHPDIELTALFGPEHGIRGDAKEGEDVTSRSEEHTSELQSRFDLVCRLQLEKKNRARYNQTN